MSEPLPWITAFSWRQFYSIVLRCWKRIEVFYMCCNKPTCWNWVSIAMVLTSRWIIPVTYTEEMHCVPVSDIICKGISKLLKLYWQTRLWHVYAKLIIVIVKPQICQVQVLIDYSLHYPFNPAGYCLFSNIKFQREFNGNTREGILSRGTGFSRGFAMLFFTRVCM